MSLVAAQPLVADRAVPDSQPVPTKGLVIANITVEFGGLIALDDVSLEVATAGSAGGDGVGAAAPASNGRVGPDATPTNGQAAPASTTGEVVGVIGPNGAGKTTLFNVISGFVRPASGHLSFDGRELRRHRPHDLNRLGIARTLQGVGLWTGLTVLDNVTAGATAQARSGLVSGLLGLPRTTRDEARLRDLAMSALDALNIAEWAGAHPGSLPYPIQKRVSLARALAAEPKLLLLDEPASGLSEAEMDDLGQLIRALRDRVSILLVEHHMDLVMSVCDRLVVLDFGRVLATGTPDEIKADDAVTEAYLGEDIAEDAIADFEGASADGPGGSPRA
jgi:branched-chain amino acid transport system ATP-binding protein